MAADTRRPATALVNSPFDHIDPERVSATEAHKRVLEKGGDVEWIGRTGERCRS